MRVTDPQYRERDPNDSMAIPVHNLDRGYLMLRCLISIVFRDIAMVKFVYYGQQLRQLLLEFYKSQSVGASARFATQLTA